MIATLAGRLHAKSDDSVVVMVGGVGYEVFVGKSLVPQLGDVGTEVVLEIYTHFNESVLQLYGFVSAADKEIFKKLISVSGIGPKLGIAIVSALPCEAVIRAIVQGDLATLTSISGIGKKTAERLVIELKDKFKDVNLRHSGHVLSRRHVGRNSREDDAIQALVSLGYVELVARQSLERIEITAEDSVQSLIKKSLGYLAS